MATESSVQPPPNHADGPHLATLTKTIGSTLKHLYTILVGKIHKLVSASYTRPNTSTLYDPGDALSDSTSAPTALTFSGMSRDDGGSGRITQAVATCSRNEVVKPQIQLWLFAAAAAPSPDNDNAAFTPTAAEILTCVGVIDFTEWEEGTAASAGNIISRATLPNGGIPYVCVTVDDLFGLVKVLNPYQPPSGGVEVFSFRLTTEQD